MTNSSIQKNEQAVSEKQSNIAYQAFEAKSNDIAKGKELKDMSDVIERLRASRQEAVIADYESGKESGEDWAKRLAEYVELRRLDEMKAGMSAIDWEHWFESGKDNAYGTNESFVFAIQPENDGDRQAAASFWETEASESVEVTDDYVRGFAEGALGVWREIKGKVLAR